MQVCNPPEICQAHSQNPAHSSTLRETPSLTWLRTDVPILLGLNENKLNGIIGTHGNWKNQNLGAVLELPAKQHYQFSLFKIHKYFSKYQKKKF